MAAPPTTIRKYYRRLARRLAKTCYGLVAGGMGVLLSYVGLNALGLVGSDAVALAGLGVAFAGLALALPMSGWLAWKQRSRLPTMPEIALEQPVQAIVCSGSRALVCTGALTFEFDELKPEELRCLEAKHVSKVHDFESGPPGRAKIWWKAFTGTGVLVSLLLAASGFTIDHLMPMAVYTSTFVASTLALVFSSARDVRIGLDGVRMGRDFVPYASLQQLIVHKGRLALVRKDGSRMEGSLQIDLTFAKALDALVQNRIDAKTSDGEAYERQQSETFEAWLKRVRGRFDATSFREAPASVDDAKRLLRDAKAPFRVRVAVALALSPIDSSYVGETLDGLVHPESASLKEALALPVDVQDSRLRELVS